MVSIAWHAAMHASHAIAHMRQISLISAWLPHSSEHAEHVAMHACSIACIAAMSKPVGRIIMRIIVLQTSAQSMHIDAHFIIPSAMPLSAHIVHACSQAEHASMHSCIVAASIAGMPIASIDMFRIISAVMLISMGSPLISQLMASSAMLRALTDHLHGSGGKDRRCRESAACQADFSSRRVRR
jgi:hypothetical protein